MPIEEAWTEIVPKFVRVPLLVYKYRKRILSWTYRGLLLLGWGRTDVVVVGRAGAGKSVLMERLSGHTGNLDWIPPNVSRTVESAVVLVKEDPLLIRTIPGQISRERDNGLHEALSSHKKLQGVIYVADWGYNAERDKALREDAVIRNGLDDTEKLRSYNLAIELSDFQYICNKLKEAHSRTNGSFWLMVVVNKADLFFDKLDDAQSYYHPRIPSAFSRAIADLERHIGTSKFQCEVVPVSAWHENFEWNGQTTSSKLNESEARALFAHMRDRLGRLSQQWNG